MYEPAEVGKVLLRLAQVHAFSDFACVNRNRSRMTSRVSVTCVEGGDKPLCERKVCTFELSIHFRQAIGQFALTLVQRKETLGGERRNEEQGQ